MNDFSATPKVFGAFRLYSAERVLLRDGEPISFTPKEFDTLLALVEAQGRVVTKEELIARVWPDSYVGEGSLPRNISVLRRTLGDDVIETVPRRGYRLAVPVTCGGSTDPEAPTPPLATSPPTSAAAFPEAVKTNPEAGPALSLPVTVPDEARWLGRHSRVLAYGVLVVLVVGIGLLLNRSTVSHAKNYPPGPVRIAVLPFMNYTGDPQKDYLSDGLTEATISELSRLSPGQLGVIARTSAMKYKNTDKAIPEIARELNADYILESSVRGSGDRVRVTAQLVRGSDASHLWTGEYERGLQNVLDIQQEVAIAVSQEIRLTLDATASRRLHGPHPVDAEAYQDYLQGRFFWNKRNREGLLKSVELFERAIARDPNYARAYAGLADSYLVLGAGYLPNIEAYEKARAAAAKAVQLDNTLSEAYTSLAYEEFINERDMKSADENYQRALRLDPNSAQAHHWYALYLAAVKRHEEAVEHIDRALELDPVAIAVRYNAGWIYLMAGRTEEALALAKRAVELDPTSAPAHGTLAAVYLEKGQYEQAIAEKRASHPSPATDVTFTMETAQIYAQVGKKNEARKLVNAIFAEHASNRVAPYSLAVTFAYLGEKEKAFYWLSRSVDDRSCTATEINNDHGLDPLRADPRFQRISSLYNQT